MPNALTTSITKLAQRSQTARWWGLIDAIRHETEALTEATDDAIRKLSLGLAYRIKSGEPLDDALVEAFALVCESARRKLGMEPYDVQLLGGIAMHHGYVAEMQTGEGKTLTASLPLYLSALEGRGVHLATANDYLAQRDADLMQPVYELLGLSVGVVTAATGRIERRAAYGASVTYGTAKEFGFDFLRDRLRLREELENGTRDNLVALGAGGGGYSCGVLRGFHFGLIDEADSVLIDEARTPLVVSALPGGSLDEAEALCRWAASQTDQFQEQTHFEWVEDQRHVELTAYGRKLVRSLPHDPNVHTVGLVDVYDRIQKAIQAKFRFRRDQHYIIRDNEIVIVDENTGRLSEGRKWRNGIHQAIEAKENVPLSPESGQAARITIQGLMLRYTRLAGMTGTAHQSIAEFKRIYQLGVIRVPTHRPSRRQRLDDRVCTTRAQKWREIAEEAAQLRREGRPVLIGTRTIEHSQELSIELSQIDLPHTVLNATHHDDEARIVAEAGRAGCITVATNMAGRGTDIQLDPDVIATGGLHVICSELHESGRIDRQLIGRCGRQGDPGSFRVYHSLDDEILATGFGAAEARRIRESNDHRKSLDHLSRLFQHAQRRVERSHFHDRRRLLQQEQDRIQLHIQLGEDPFLDSPL